MPRIPPESVGDVRIRDHSACQLSVESCKRQADKQTSEKTVVPRSYKEPSISCKSASRPPSPPPPVYLFLSLSPACLRVSGPRPARSFGTLVRVGQSAVSFPQTLAAEHRSQQRLLLRRLAFTWRRLGADDPRWLEDFPFRRTTAQSGSP